MLVTLISKNSIHKITLPQIIAGNYWLSDKNNEKERKLVNIEAKDGNWQVVSDSHVKVIKKEYIGINNNNIDIIRNDDTDILTDKIILKEYETYGLYIGNTAEVFLLYCSPVYEDDFLHLDIKNCSNFFIGRDNNNNIIYNNSFIAKKHFHIYISNGRWIIENINSTIGTFVNDVPVLDKDIILSNGDVIFLMGLRIIIIGNSIFINNPNNKVKYNSDYFEVNDKSFELKYEIEEDQNSEIEMYEKKDYYSRAPRIINIIEREKIRIDAPPRMQEPEQMPAALALGSTLAMGAMLVISIAITIDGRINGTATTKSTIFSLLMALTMLVSMILFPILTRKYEKNRKMRYEEKRQKRYQDYLNSKVKTINAIKTKQRNILLDNYVSTEECAKIILERKSRLWERKIEDFDFLGVRLGIGNIPLDIEIQYPEEQFAMEDDKLVEMLNDMATEAKTLNLAPIVVSFAEKNISAIITKDNEDLDKIMKSIIIQLITFHNYEDLKMVFLLKKDNIKNWEYVKMLPHVWDNTRQIRFFADEYDDMIEISKYLEEELKNRLQYENKDYKSFIPYYLIITDDYKKVENLRVISEILKSKINVGFSILCITGDLMQLPNECKTFITLNDKKGMLFENEISSTNQRDITYDTSVTVFFSKICNKIANIPIRYNTTDKMMLLNNYAFLDMYDVGCIEQLNIGERWNRNDSTLSLKVPIGIDETGNQIALDIHEDFHGPHGLIAGSTGSGKSEFIITYILSLALNYHPDDVTFVLIDYKGGGVAGAFQRNDIKLPHLVGTITNIDTVGLQRTLVSIQSELRRRQIIFNEARNRTDEGTIDIYKYQKLYHQGLVEEPISHLLIICDEFAELKQQQEEFMEELISVSRIGRSLGVHLILATQKPAGIVNDQIRSNSRFAVCLKVQNREDSNDVIKKPDAVKLKKAGQFFLQVGNDEYFVLGQSAWSGAPYIPSNINEKKLDNSIQFISNIGIPIKRMDDTIQKILVTKGEQLTNLVRFMSDLAKQNNIQTKNLWLDNIPENIYIKDIKKKYNFKKDTNNITSIIGEYDDSFNQHQGIVRLDLKKEGNIIIYGNAESGKETLLSTITYDLMTTYNAEDVQVYIIDCGSEALKIFKESPVVGDVAFVNEDEKIGRLFNIIQKFIKERKTILSDYNGDYDLYVSKNKGKMPLIVVILNNYELFYEIYEDKYDDMLLTITRECIKYGILFIVTASAYNDLRYRLTQNFRQKIALQVNNQDDYLNIFDNVGKLRPSHLFGRGLIRLNDNKVYEFQTAKICESGEYNIHIKQVIEKLTKPDVLYTEVIPVIPNRIALNDLSKYNNGITEIPLGITKKEIKVLTYDFKKNFITIITSKNMEYAIHYTYYLLEEVKYAKNVDILVFDAERILSSKRKELKNQLKELNERIVKNNKFTLCVFIGLDKIINDVIESENEFYSLLKKAQENENMSFIIIDNPIRIKQHEYDGWYKNYMSGEDGIWVGNGMNDQYLINTIVDRNEIINNCGCSFGYVIKQGIPIFIKLLEMKENGDDNE